MSLFFRIAANACITGGVLLGLVSLAALLYFGTALLQASPPPSASAAPEGSLLLGFFYGLGKVVSFLGGIADAIIKAFIALSAVGFGLGMMLFQTGRGLRTGKRWAKAMALMLLPAFGFGALFAAAILR